jgi:lipopolysaccharide export system protein LptC
MPASSQSGAVRGAGSDNGGGTLEWRDPDIAGFDMTPAASRGGFKAANRHTARVRWLRRGAIAFSILATALISGVVLFHPFKHLPGDISVGRVGIDGTKITLGAPKITGLQKDGRPYEVKAHSGIQDITTPNVIELLGIDSTIGTADAATTWVSAAHGVYDSLNDKMSLEGDVQIKNSSGYDIRMKTARIDFKTGGLISEDPVKVLIDGGTIAANRMDVSDNGHKVSFGGDVTSIIEAEAKETDAGGALTEKGK